MYMYSVLCRQLTILDLIVSYQISISYIVHAFQIKNQLISLIYIPNYYIILKSSMIVYL